MQAALCTIIATCKSAQETCQIWCRLYLDRQQEQSLICLLQRRFHGQPRDRANPVAYHLLFGATWLMPGGHKGCAVLPLTVTGSICY